MNTRGHVKIPGFVTAVSGDRWWARLDIDGLEYEAEMRDPLPKGMGEGSLFTMHRTKRGHTYLFWITKPLLTQRKLKKARQWARDIQRSLGWGERVLAVLDPTASGQIAATDQTDNDNPKGT